MQICQQCNRQNRDQARFCQFCGAPLLEERLCPQCGTKNPPNARFCIHCASALDAAESEHLQTGTIPPNTVLGGRYTIRRKLGRGGMGAVYLVGDGRLNGKLWAVKEMSDAALTDHHEKQQAIQAFKHEASLLAALEHPNLTKVVDFFADKGKHFLVMDYIEGKTLAEMLHNRQHPFSEGEVLAWAKQLCDVLHYLHTQSQPIIFRDLKPGNIMVDNTGKIRLIDFGIARLFKPGKKQDTMSYGTSGYAPPEQYGRGQTDARSDIYALGATLHHLLTLRDPGDQPFRFPSVRQLNPKVSMHVDFAIMKALEQDALQRWGSVEEFADALFNVSEKTHRTEEEEEINQIPPTMVASPQPVSTQTSQDLSTPVTQDVEPQPNIKELRRFNFFPTLIVFVVMTALLFLWMSNPQFSDSLFILSFEFGVIANSAIYSLLVLLPPVITKRPLMAFLPTAIVAFLLGADAVPYLGAMAMELVFALTRYRRYNILISMLAMVSGFFVIKTYEIAILGNEGIYFDEVLYNLIGFGISVIIVAFVNRFVIRN